MINSVSEIRTVKAYDLPHTFDILIGQTVYPFEVRGLQCGNVLLRCTSTNEDIYIDQNEMMTILVPDTLENARMDIEFDLMQQGLL
jgi:hypothetical protein